MLSTILMTTVLKVIFIILESTFCFLNILFIFKYLHLFQLKDYSVSRYIKYLLKQHWLYFSFNVLLIVTNLTTRNEILLLISVSIMLMINPLLNFNLITSQKTPIKYTSKFKRLLDLSIALIIICCFIPFGVLFINVMMFFIPTISNTLNLFDINKNRQFIKCAQEKLRLSKAKVIAITGSNGKTSVKNILEKMLRTKYKVLATPKSYNTPLGISKFINEKLDDGCEFVILEYGARKRGDVKKLCELFGADYGIITTIAPQHLETFKSVENIFNEKNELPKFLKSELCVFNLDNLYTLRMFNLKDANKLGVSIFSKADVFASDIYLQNFKTHFNLHFNGEDYKVSTPLLGRHNVLNITLATALASRLGVENNDVISAIENLEFTPHRLGLIKSNINILDDSYNCSLLSARESIWVLENIEEKTCEKNLKNNKNSSNFAKNNAKNGENIENLKIFIQKSNFNIYKNTSKNSQNKLCDNVNLLNKKVVCSPGIIEAGKFEYDINFRLGAMFKNLDEVIIVGEHNKKAIYEGLKSVNFDDNKIVFCSSLEQAKLFFKTLKEGDCLLLLNDLPDDYN